MKRQITERALTNIQKKLIILWKFMEQFYDQDQSYYSNIDGECAEDSKEDGENATSNI